MSISLSSLWSKKFFTPVLFVGGALLLLAGFWLWWTKIDTNPERVFWGAIERGLSTTSATTVVNQPEGAGPAIHQVSQYSLGAANSSHTMSRLTQGGTQVVNEMFGTPEAAYRRYASIKTDQKRADGSPLDLSKIVGIWAEGADTTSQVLQQTVLGSALPSGGATVPLGYLEPAARSKLMNQIQREKVYDVAFDKVKKEYKDGRLLYTYDVTVSPFAYASMIKQLAEGLGMHGLDQLDPSQYKSQPPIAVKLVIDVHARHVVRAVGTGYEQDYASYDVPVRMGPPKDHITDAELQQRLQNLQ